MTLLSARHGLIVISGPAKSGKSTTLSSLGNYLHLHKRGGVNIIDPILDLGSVEHSIQATRSSRLVLASIEADDAASTVGRLIRLGISPDRLNQTLQGIITQRLIRSICTECREEVAPTEDVLKEVGLTRGDSQGRCFYRGKGCACCNQSGYSGHQAIFEIMLITECIKELITKHASIDQVRHVARIEGMRTLREAALLAVVEGTTTIEQAVC